jgi:hypothetical protein
MVPRRSGVVVISPDKNGLLWINDLSGGLNDTDAPQDLAANQCQVAQNVEWITTKFAQRRQGGTNGIHATEPWGSQTSLVSLIRHTPSADETAAELFGLNADSTPVLGRLAAGNQFSAVTVGDAWTQADTPLLNGASLNGNLFLAGNTAVDRLHYWDGTALRRTALATPAAPTVANTGAGSYAATIRYYKVQYLRTTGSRSHSEWSAATAFTPSGGGTAARITKPASISENETDWRVAASPDGVNYYVLNAGTAVGTTTIDDSTAPSGYPGLGILPGFPMDADYFTAPPSAKVVLADEDRLVLLSSWEVASMASAVMWTPVQGTSDPSFVIDDTQRVPSTNRLDLDRQDGGGIVGGAILNGAIYVFKQGQIYRLDRTGDDDLPYQPRTITKSLGALSHKSIILGEDDAGNACLYFLSRRGPYRVGPDGLEFLGRDIETFWRTVDLSSNFLPPFGVWHAEKRQVWWWVRTLSAPLNSMDKVLVFHARYGRRDGAGNVRGGVAVYTDGPADAFSAVMFAKTLGATMSLDLKPYVGQRWQTSLPDGPCIKYDADGTYTDRGGLQTTYIGRVKTWAFAPGGPGMKGRVTQTYVLGTPANRSLAIDVVEDFGARTRSGTAALPAASGSETRELVKVDDDARAADAMYVEIVLDDDVSPASGAAWTVDAIGLRVKTEGQI